MFKASFLLYYSVLCGLVHAQDGDFTFPPDLADPQDQSTFLRWTEGTVVTVEWNSTYARNNFYYAQFGDDARSQALSLNTEATQFEWTVKPASMWSNRSIPFHFHIVDADGSAGDQTGGGFWSVGFFVLAAESSSTSSTVTASTSVPATQSSTSAPILSVSSATATLTLSSASASSTAIGPSNSNAGLSGGGIAGAVIGSVVALAGFGALLYWYGRRRAIAKTAASNPQLQHQHESNYYSDFVPPTEVPNKTQMVEAEGDSTVAHVPPAELD